VQQPLQVIGSEKVEPAVPNVGEHTRRSVASTRLFGREGRGLAGCGEADRRGAHAEVTSHAPGKPFVRGEVS